MMRWRTLLSSIGLLALTCPAQVGPKGRPLGPGGQVITVQNLTPFARREWVRTVVPFKKGVVRGRPDLRVGNGPTVWQPFGARWPDGSVRQAICLFPVQMNRLSEVALRVAGGTPEPVPKDVEIIDPLAIQAARVKVELKVAGKVEEALPELVRELESNPARKVLLYRCRVGKTGLVFEFILECYAGQAHCYVSMGAFFSDPDSQRMRLAVEELAVSVTGMRLVVRHAGILGADNLLRGGGSRVRLLRDAVLGDGQGLRRLGVLTPLLKSSNQLRDQTLQAATLGPILAATKWGDSGAFGPFGHVPKPPTWLSGNQVRAAMAKRHAGFVKRSSVRGNPFVRLPYQLAKNPGSTGNQNDFGIIKMAPVASTGLPSFLLEVEPSVLQEACRPVHYFESDGSMFKAANHKDLVMWTGRPHWKCDISKDRLGKKCPEPKFFKNGWKPKDRQHWSSNYLCAYYLLTGDHWARREIENEAQLFLASQTIKDGLATTGPGAPRAVGRMLLLGCWLHQCTGDKALLDRMQQRMQKSYYMNWAGRTFPEDAVRPMAIKNADRRILRGASKYWSPWQESLAAIGLFAFYRTTDHPLAKKMSDAIAKTILDHGWLIGRQGAQIGYAMRWNEDRSPLSRAERLAAQPTVCKWAGGGISTWSMGAVQIARHFALQRKDEDRIARADRILQLVRRTHGRPPSDGWWGDHVEWDAVR